MCNLHSGYTFYFMKILYRLGKYLMKKSCPHDKLKIIYECYQDRYIKYECKKCKKHIFKDL